MRPEIPRFESHEALDVFLSRLVNANWDTSDGPIQFYPNLSMPDLENASFFQNTRLFLSALYDENGVNATAVGNLTRKFVHWMFDRMTFSPSYYDSDGVT